MSIPYEVRPTLINSIWLPFPFNPHASSPNIIAEPLIDLSLSNLTNLKLTMRPLIPAPTALLRHCARTHLPSATAIRPALLQIRGKADTQLPSDSMTSSSFDSPFKNMRDPTPTTQIPRFDKYKSKRSREHNLVFQYFMVGTMGLLAAAGAKGTVQSFLVNMSASADVLAQAKVEVDLAAIPIGKNVIIKWRGKPVFIRHRTDSEIKEAETASWESLRDPQPDSERVKKPEWLVMVGVCTHLGCVPIGESGDFGGWFCPCHGSHYDISGRARKGPAPLNLAIPDYDFPTADTIVIG